MHILFFFHRLFVLWDRSAVPRGPSVFVYRWSVRCTVSPACLACLPACPSYDIWMWFSLSLHFSTGFWGLTMWRPLIHHTICAKCFFQSGLSPANQARWVDIQEQRMRRQNPFYFLAEQTINSSELERGIVWKNKTTTSWGIQETSLQFDCALVWSGVEMLSMENLPQQNWKHWNMFRWPEQEATVSSAHSLSFFRLSMGWEETFSPEPEVKVRDRITLSQTDGGGQKV